MEPLGRHFARPHSAGFQPGCVSAGTGPALPVCGILGVQPRHVQELGDECLRRGEGNLGSGLWDAFHAIFELGSRVSKVGGTQRLGPQTFQKCAPNPYVKTSDRSQRSLTLDPNVLRNSSKMQSQSKIKDLSKQWSSPSQVSVWGTVKDEFGKDVPAGCSGAIRVRDRALWERIGRLAVPRPFLACIDYWRGETFLLMALLLTLAFSECFAKAR